MTYQQTIDYLYKHLPMFSRVGSIAYKEDLHNTIALCKALGDPQNAFKSIHIAGTNGKGSTSHMLAAILQEAGYKTGLYTSPHLKDFRERIRINGEMIPEQVVTAFVERMESIIRSVEPSFFELTVAMAFDYFAKEAVDIAVIETGLGGRLDSTNVITPILSVITNIGYDHMNILGNTLEAIASEKAGIIKPGIPVVIGEYLPQTKKIFLSKAADMHAPIHFASEEFRVSHIHPSGNLLTCDVTDTGNGITETFRLDLTGLYQVKNLCTVLSAEGILAEKGFPIRGAAEKKGLQEVKQLTGLYGRWDLVREKPYLILDVAHNEDGIKQVLDQVRFMHDAGTINTSRQIHLVIGMVRDKDLSKILSLLPASANYYFTHAHIPRALTHLELKDKAAAYGLKGESFTDVNLAIKHAIRSAAPNDLIIVCGSVFVVGEVDTTLFTGV